MTEDAVPTVYSRLDHATSQIRLLHLQPRLNNGGEITCSLSLCNLDDEKSKYEALSYEWGDYADTSHSIRLDGSKFAVRANLWLALFHLRDNDSIRVLWIDALCINQANEGERNHQVRQMGTIYQRAVRVVAWIGPSVSNAAVSVTNIRSALQFAGLIYGQSERSRFYFTGQFWVRYTGTESAGETLKDSRLQFTDSRWWILLDTLQRSYWERLWIIQELVLASDIVIQFGNLTLDFGALEHVFKESQYLRDLNPAKADPKSTPRLPAAVALFKTTSFKLTQQRFERTHSEFSSHNIFDLCYRYQKAACSDLRDKVFALLGMSQTCCQRAVEVDYGKNPLDICRVLLQHQFEFHDNHDFDLNDFKQRGSNFRLFTMTQAIFALFENSDSKLDSNDEKPLFTNHATDKSVAILCCRLIGPITSLIDNRWGTNVENMRGYYIAGSLGVEGHISKCIDVVKIGYSVFLVNSHDIIIVRLLTSGYQLVGEGSIRSSNEQSAAAHTSMLIKASLDRDLLYLDIFSLHAFCKISRPAAKYMLVGKYCESCKICTRPKFEA